MRSASLILLFTVAISACSETSTGPSDPTATGPLPSLSTQTQAPDADVIRVPLSGVFFNACSGENIAWNGEATFVVRFLFEPGGFHRIFVRSLRATGTGLTSGDTYLMREAATLNANASFTFGTNPANIATHATIVNTTSGGVFNGLLRFHVTRNALGEIVVVFTDLEIKCVG